ncbi:MAG: MerR family transcriptional regulator [Synergistaceae bacterium]|nr:MerR family transcriptional regulator [Synergistaceae bacterium]
MTIGEAAERTGLTADTLRYYERIGLIPPVPRTDSGLRVYSDEMIAWIMFIQRFKELGMSLDAILNYVKLAMHGRDTRQARKVILLETRRNLMDKIDRLYSCLKEADYQLEHYDSRLLPETESAVERWRSWESAAERSYAL